MPGTYAGTFDVDGDWTLRAERLIVRDKDGQPEIGLALSGFVSGYGRFQVGGMATSAAGGYEAVLQFRYDNFPKAAPDTAKIRLQVEESPEGCHVEGWWTEMGEDGEITEKFSGDLQPWEPL